MTLRASASAPAAVQFTPRQREMIALVAAGMQNKHIAFELELSEQTVKNNLHRICCKLGLKNRAELASWAIVHGIVRSEGESHESR